MEKVNWIGNPNVGHIKRSLFFELNGWKSDKVIILLVFPQSLKSTAQAHTHTHIFHCANPSVENMWEAHFNCRVIRSYTNAIEAVASKIVAAIKNEVSPIMKSHFRPKPSLTTHNDRCVCMLDACVRACWRLFVYVNKKKEKSAIYLYVYALFIQCGRYCNLQ